VSQLLDFKELSDAEGFLRNKVALNLRATFEEQNHQTGPTLVPFRHQPSPTKEKKDPPHVTDVKPVGPVEDKADAKPKKADAIAALSANLELAIQRWKEKDAVCDLKDMTHIQNYDFTNADYLEAAVRAGFRDYKPSNQGDITCRRLRCASRSAHQDHQESPRGVDRTRPRFAHGRYRPFRLLDLVRAEGCSRGRDARRVLPHGHQQADERVPHARSAELQGAQGQHQPLPHRGGTRRNNAVYDVVYLNYSKFSNDLKAPDVEMGPRVDAPTYLKNLGEEMGAAAQIQATVKTLTHLLATTESATPTLQTRRPLMTPQRAIPRAPSSGIVLRWPPCSNHASRRRASAARAAVRAVPWSRRNEHHDFPALPWTALPKLRALAPEFYETLQVTESWLGAAMNFVLDDNVGVWARVKREEGAGKRKVLLPTTKDAVSVDFADISKQGGCLASI
jgi:hypothetical protein